MAAAGLPDFLAALGLIQFLGVVYAFGFLRLPLDRTPSSAWSRAVDTETGEGIVRRAAARLHRLVRAEESARRTLALEVSEPLLRRAAYRTPPGEARIIAALCRSLGISCGKSKWMDVDQIELFA